MVTTNTDVERALRESEERWRTLLAHIQEMVIFVDSGDLVTYASPSIERWLGYRAEELVGRRITALTDGDDVALRAALARCASGTPISVKHRLRDRNGFSRRLESTIVCLRQNSRVGGVLMTCRDVTQRHALEQGRDRLDLDRRVSHRLEAVGQLAAGIAHEINTPLQFVGDSVTFLEEAVHELVRLTGLYRMTLYTSSPIPPMHSTVWRSGFRKALV